MEALLAEQAQAKARQAQQPAAVTRARTFIVVEHANADDFADAVRDRLNEGWTLHGATSAVPTSDQTGVLHSQAMIRDLGRWN
jgi:hypothetical protein